MNVLVVLNEDVTPTGVGTYAHYLAELLPQLGHTVRLVYPVFRNIRSNPWNNDKELFLSYEVEFVDKTNAFEFAELIKWSEFIFLLNSNGLPDDHDFRDIMLGLHIRHKTPTTMMIHSYWDYNDTDKYPFVKDMVNITDAVTVFRDTYYQPCFDSYDLYRFPVYCMQPWLPTTCRVPSIKVSEKQDYAITFGRHLSENPKKLTTIIKNMGLNRVDLYGHGISTAKSHETYEFEGVKVNRRSPYKRAEMGTVLRNPKYSVYTRNRNRTGIPMEWSCLELLNAGVVPIAPEFFEESFERSRFKAYYYSNKNSYEILNPELDWKEAVLNNLVIMNSDYNKEKALKSLDTQIRHISAIARS